MKKRTDVIAEAAARYVSGLPRRQTPTTIIDSVLPEAAKDLGEVQPFAQKTPAPRHITKVLCSALIERVLAGRARFVDVAGVLTSTERDYVLNVLDEVEAWARAQGFEVPQTDWVFQPQSALAEARA